MEIDTKKEETRLTNPERQMKHENRLSLFLTDSHGKIIDHRKNARSARRQDEGTIY